MEKRQRKRERERGRLRRGEKAGTRSHLSLLSRCWRQSRQTLRRPLRRWWRRRWLPSFVPRRTRFVIFKAEHRQECLSSSRRRLAPAPRDASSRPFYFSPTYPSLRPLPFTRYLLSPSASLYFLHPLFSI